MMKHDLSDDERRALLRELHSLYEWLCLALDEVYKELHERSDLRSNVLGLVPCVDENKLEAVEWAVSRFRDALVKSGCENVGFLQIGDFGDRAVYKDDLVKEYLATISTEAGNFYRQAQDLLSREDEPGASCENQDRPGDNVSMIPALGASCFPAPEPIPAPKPQHSPYYSYCPKSTDDDCEDDGTEIVKPREGIFAKIGRLFSRKDKGEKAPVISDVRSTVYSPAQAGRGEDILVQVFLYEDELKAEIGKLATESDPGAVRRYYDPLVRKISIGSKVGLTIRAKGCVVEDDHVEMTWEGGMLRHEFTVSVPSDFDKSNFISVVTLSVDGMDVGAMKFTTAVVGSPKAGCWANVESVSFKKSFISFMSEDRKSVDLLAEGFRIQKEINGIDYFFSAHTLHNGDNYPKLIEEYIATCDVFVLCWSANAEKSAWVEREYRQALDRYKRGETICMRLYNIAPRAPFPKEIVENFHVDELG